VTSEPIRTTSCSMLRTCDIIRGPLSTSMSASAYAGGNSGLGGRCTIENVYIRPVPGAVRHSRSSALHLRHNRRGNQLSSPHDAHHWNRSTPSAQPCQNGPESSSGIGSRRLTGPPQARCMARKPSARHIR
jgi:hypothetical protein